MSRARLAGLAPGAGGGGYSTHIWVYRVALKFLRVLIFAFFAVFFAIRKNKFPQNKSTANIFSRKTYSTVEIIYKNTGLKEKMP